MLRKRGKMWHSRIMVAGFAYQKSLKTHDKQEALRREAAWRLELTSGDFGLSAGNAPTLLQFEDRFFDALRLQVKPKTLEYYKTMWKPLALSLGGTRLNRITEPAIEQFKQKRAKEEVATATLNGSLRCLRRALRLANRWNIIRKVPHITISSNERRREFTIDEPLLDKMLKHDKCPASFQNLLPFLIDTGLRVGECLALTWDRVDLTKQMIFIDAGKTQFARRHVPLTSRARDILNRIERNGAPVFNDVGTHYTLSHQFRSLRDALKLPDDCVLHSCRHTFCTRLGAAGVDAFTLQRLAGHSSIIVSARYVHPDADNMKAAVAKLEA